MGKDRMKHIDCFEDRDKQTALPEPIPVSRIGETVTQEIDAVVEKVKQRLDIRFYGARQKKNISRLRELETHMKQIMVEPDPQASLRTLHEVQTAYRKARALVRAGVTPHAEYPDRRIDPEFSAEVECRFIAVCEQWRKELTAQLKATFDALAEKKRQETERKFLPLFRGYALKRIRELGGRLQNANGRPIVAGDETVNAANLSVFGEFLLCIDDAVASASKGDECLRIELIKAIHALCGEDQAKWEFYGRWVDTLFPDSVRGTALQRMNIEPLPLASDEGNGNGLFTHPESIFLPKKLACVRKRKEPDGEPVWPLTSEEHCALLQLRKQRLAEKKDIPPEEDGEFLQQAATVLNRQCSGNLPLVRPQIEVRHHLRELANHDARNASAEPTTIVPKEDPASTSPPPPTPEPDPPSAPMNWDLMEPDAVLYLLDTIRDDTQGGQYGLDDELAKLKLPRAQYTQWITDLQEIRQSQAMLTQQRETGEPYEGRVPPFLRRFILCAIAQACPPGEEPSDALLAQHGLTSVRYRNWKFPSEREKREPRPRARRPRAPQPFHWKGKQSDADAPAVTVANNHPAPPTAAAETVFEPAPTAERPAPAPAPLPPELQLVSDWLDQREQVIKHLLSNS
jgi:hypothetical protein